MTRQLVSLKWRLTIHVNFLLQKESENGSRC